jgi:Mn-dependent DtxR family transcriptional regulator
MTPDVEVEAILEALKRRLRERGVTYAEVAKALDVSLPTVKRMLNKGAIPLATLARIAALAGVSIAELGAQAERPKITFFDARQDDLFFERPEMLAYFLRLQDGATPREIEREARISRASTTAYLLALDRVGLIEMLPDDRVRLRVKPPSGFSRTSRTMARDLRQTLDRVADGVFAKLHAPADDMILLKPMRLGREAYRELRAELRAIVERYAVLGAREKDAEAIVVAVLCDRFAEAPRPIPEIAHSSMRRSS